MLVFYSKIRATMTAPVEVWRNLLNQFEILLEKNRQIHALAPPDGNKTPSFSKKMGVICSRKR